MATTVNWPPGFCRSRFNCNRQLLRRNGPVPGILAADRSGAIVYSSPINAPIANANALILTPHQMELAAVVMVKNLKSQKLTTILSLARKFHQID
jgi:hypothetical protein